MLSFRYPSVTETVAAGKGFCCTPCFCDGGYRTQTQHKCTEFNVAFLAFVMADTEPGPSTNAQNVEFHSVILPLQRNLLEHMYVNENQSTPQYMHIKKTILLHITN